MSERYPDDASLEAISADAQTGVEMIPTGKSPYYIQFRRLVQRMLLSFSRANDLRVYQDGDLSVGIRAGRCFIGNATRQFAGCTGLSVTPGDDNYFWLDASATIQTNTTGFPTDRTNCIPLAMVSAGSSAITAIQDARGETFLAVPNLPMLGITATANAMNTALQDVNTTVTASHLNTLTAGTDSTADALHRHLIVHQNVNDEAYFTLINGSSNSAANVALVLSLPGLLADDLVLLPDTSSGFLTQRFNGVTYHALGCVHAQCNFPGTFSASVTGKLMDAIPVDGVVTDVILSVKTNLQSSTTSDGLSALVKVNGNTLTSTHPKITSAAGAGFCSTAQGHGTAASIVTTGVRNVRKGDVLTVDLTRTAAGSVSTQAADVVVFVVIRVSKPE